MNDFSVYTDDRLVELYRDGHNKAFDELLMRHKDRVFSYIFSLVKNEDMANDIFQDTFIKIITIIKGGEGYTNTGRFLPWVMRIAHNMVIDVFRKHEQFKVVDSDDCNLSNSLLLSEPQGGAYEHREKALRNVENMISQLPDEQKRVVKMRYYKELSFKDIADIENISVNTALGRMHYALLNMRRNPLCDAIREDLNQASGY